MSHIFQSPYAGIRYSVTPPLRNQSINQTINQYINLLKDRQSINQ